MISDTDKYKVPNRGSYNFKKIPLNDPRVFSAFSKGDTVGVFQLEKKLGQDWSKKLKPDNIDHIAALVALLRPACLESMMSESYCNRKNGLEEVQYFHPSLVDIFKNTYGTNVYQEQNIRIGMEIAGMTEEEADTYIRKGIGKKLPEVIAECKKRFLEGCKKVGKVNEAEAEEIFSWLEKAQRYQFNKCLSPDTIVETDCGYKLISEIQIGENVKTPYGFAQVLDLIDQGLQDLFEVELESGKKIKCTMNHKFLCENGEILPLIEILEQNFKIVCEKE